MLTDNSLRVYRLGLWYGSYRVFVAISLFLIFILNLSVFQNYYGTDFFFGLLLFYSTLCIFQFLIFSFLVKKRESQALLFGLSDVLCFSILSFSLGQVNFYIGLLFVVTVFIVNLVLNEKTAIGLTVTAIIATIYPPFLTNLSWDMDDRVLLDALTLCVLFTAMCVIARFVIKSIERLESINISKTIDLEQIKKINNAILEKIDTGYIVLSDDFKILLINPAARQTLKLSRIESNELKYVMPTMYAALIKRLKIYDKFVFDFKGDGLEVQISFQKLDLTHQSLLLIGLEEVEKLNNRVQSLKLASLGQLSASIAHEIRNPLASIVQANSLILGSSNEKVERYVGIIKNQSKRIDKIISSTLNMAKNTGVNPEIINLNTFFCSLMTDDVQDVAEFININVPNGLNILFDESQLKSVFINLIRNAIRHNSPDQFIEVLAYINEEHVFVDVIDHGQGVEQSKIQNLFAPFFSTSTDGTGLGLYLCKNLCELNHAKIEYVSITAGACFRVKCKTIA